MENDQAFRRQLLALLRGGNAHLPFEAAVADFPMEAINRLPPEVSYSPWELLEHLRITQWDILDFIRNPNYVYMAWPDDYWPPKGTQADPTQWQATIEAFRADLEDLARIIEDPATDLTTDLAHAPGYNILREILVVSDHNAYHIGEFAILRQVMGTWPKDRKE
jgi:hypothetical protein